MKKHLFGTTAFVAVSLATSGAMAQSLDDRIRTLEEQMLMGSPGSDFDVDISGWIQGGFFVQDIDPDTIGAVANYVGATGMEDYADYDVKMSGAEVQFRASTRLYNAIRIGGRVELSGFTTRDQVDETYIWMESRFGRVILGADDDVYNKMHYSVPFPSLNGVDSPNYRHTAATAVRAGTNASLAGDSNKLSYFTPRIAGVQLGISYTPHNGNRNGEANASGARDLNSVSLKNVIGVGATFRRRLSGFWVGASAGWQGGTSNVTYDPDGPEGACSFSDVAETPSLRVCQNKPRTGIKTDPSSWHIGSTFSRDGWRLGGAYARYKAHGSSLTTNLGRPFSPARVSIVPDHVDISDRVEQTVWAVGVSYSIGPWTAGIGYLQSEGDGVVERVNRGRLVPDDIVADGLRDASPETTVLGLGASYKMARGVTLGADVAFYEDNNGLSGEDAATVEAAGGGLILGINF